ncbi:MAG: hypothetical protein IKF71_00350 [Bacilli bacterium]|nr:hypothetical protein [Bacilli bacterium]
MNKEYMHAYLDGIMNMASSLSKNMGPSYILVDCYNKEEFDKYFKIKYTSTTLSFEEKLKEWFMNDQKTIDSILHWTHRYIKEIKKIYTISEKELEKLEKTTLFYTVEDMFILETKDYMITYILGNNE